MLIEGVRKNTNTYRSIDRQKWISIDRQTDRQTESQTDRQTDRYSTVQYRSIRIYPLGEVGEVLVVRGQTRLELHQVAYPLVHPETYLSTGHGTARDLRQYRTWHSTRPTSVPDMVQPETY
eukprot:3940821-Rhodomonas_salina.1